MLYNIYSWVSTLSIDYYFVEMSPFQQRVLQITSL